MRKLTSVWKTSSHSGVKRFQTNGRVQRGFSRPSLEVMKCGRITTFQVMDFNFFIFAVLTIWWAGNLLFNHFIFLHLFWSRKKTHFCFVFGGSVEMCFFVCWSFSAWLVCVPAQLRTHCAEHKYFTCDTHFPIWLCWLVVVYCDDTMSGFSKKWIFFSSHL